MINELIKNPKSEMENMMNYCNQLNEKINLLENRIKKLENLIYGLLHKIDNL